MPVPLHMSLGFERPSVERHGPCLAHPSASTYLGDRRHVAVKQVRESSAAGARGPCCHALARLLRHLPLNGLIVVQQTWGWVKVCGEDTNSLCPEGPGPVAHPRANLQDLFTLHGNTVGVC